jgi:hypothetical protein
MLTEVEKAKHDAIYLTVPTKKVKSSKGKFASNMQPKKKKSK